jgi:transposase-like protein
VTFPEGKQRTRALGVYAAMTGVGGGVTVDHVTVYRWVQRFTLEFIEAARPCRHVPGDRWFIDETYVKAAGRWTYLYRAVDQHGQVIDVLLSARRDLAVARRFLTWALHAGTVPAEVTTDRAPRWHGTPICALWAGSMLEAALST